MLNINLLKNNIPNKIDIPKKSKLHIAKFLAIFLAGILAIFLAIIAGFYFVKKHSKIYKTDVISKTQKSINNISKNKAKSIVENNNTFNITVKLQNATSNATVPNLQSSTKEPIIQKKPDINASILKKVNTNTKQVISSQKSSLVPQTIQKSCTIICTENNLNNLKAVLNQKHIQYTIKEQSKNLRYYYVVFVGGLEKSKFLNFENALKSKGYNVVGTRVVNGKYYANLGKMNESDKDRFLAAWKNLGFDILVDKQQEMSNKSYQVQFLCTKDVFRVLEQKGFKANAGRGAAW